jgi:hypothetical protein
MDAKSLLGAYVCTAVPGEFAWQPGPLTQVRTRTCTWLPLCAALQTSLSCCVHNTHTHTQTRPPTHARTPPPYTHIHIQAVAEGRWVVIEDINMAPPDVLAALVPLLESRTLTVASRGEVGSLYVPLLKSDILLLSVSRVLLSLQESCTLSVASRGGKSGWLSLLCFRLPIINVAKTLRKTPARTMHM